MNAATSAGATVPAEYFRKLYQKQLDPWGFATSAYDRAKYYATLGALPQLRYAGALELGCSIGVFTAMLARRCDRVLAVDCAPAAVHAARERCANLRGVTVTECDLATSFPGGRYDLVTFCELGFYFNVTDLARIRNAIATALERAGDLVLVHWIPPVEGHAQSTDAVHDSFLRDTRFGRMASARTSRYRLDVLRRS